MTASTWAQLRALLALVGKRARRRALRAGDAPRLAGAPAFPLLMAASYLYLAGVLYHLGTQVAAQESGRTSSVRILLWSFFALALTTSLMWSGAQIGRVRSVLRSAFLDTLPLGLAARSVIAWIQSAALSLLAPVTLLAAAPEARTTGGVAFVIASALLASVAGSLFGQAIAAAIRVAGATLPQRLLPWIGVLGGIVPLLGLFNAAVLGARWTGDGDPMLYAARALLGGEGRALVLLAHLVAVMVAIVALLVCERAGYDREDRPAVTRFRSRTASPARTELRILWRQGTGKLQILQAVLTIGLLAVAGTLLASPAKLATAKGRDLLHEMTALLAAQAALYMAMTVMTAASSAIARDLQARPFLSALPTTPAQTLAHKAGALRALNVPVFAALVALAAFFVARAPIAGAGFAAGHAARLVLLAAGLYLLCGLAPCVAFLTRGLGAGDGERQGMPSMIVSALIMMPLIAIVVVPTWPQAVAALATLAALAFEARRAAERCVSWIDDAGDAERDTPIWRALLALGGFYSAQALVGQALLLAPLPPGVRLALVYAAGGVVLVVLSLRARPRPAVRAPSAGWDLVGLVGGVASGSAAVGFALLLRRLGADLPEEPLGGRGALVAAAIAITVVAPLCEELFFRGWLQAAIARELSPARTRLAPLLGACAFAAAHVGSAVVPQLVLGLVAGVLFQRTGRLRPGILAHAAHNAVVLAAMALLR